MISYQFKKSFTLVEVLVAAAILTIGMVSAIGTFSVGIKYANSAKQEAAASGIMQEAMESALALGYDNISAGTWERVRFSGDPASPFYGFETQISVFFVDGDLSETILDNGLKKIKAIVFWTDSGIEKSEEAIALIARQ